MLGKNYIFSNVEIFGGKENTQNSDQEILGPPVDELDRACRAWHKCHQCTTIDNDSCGQSF